MKLGLTRISVKSTPNNLKVGGSLDLTNCINPESLSDNLEVGGDLYLKGCKPEVIAKAQELKDEGQIKGKIITN